MARAACQNGALPIRNRGSAEAERAIDRKGPDALFNGFTPLLRTDK
jgi:hypothetical protein